MNARKSSQMMTIRGVEVKLASFRVETFWAWEREDGTFVQTSTCRRTLWENKGIAFVKVTSMILTTKGAMPGAASDERNMVRQTIIGTSEHIDKYLGDLRVLSGIAKTDDGVSVEWTF